MYKRPQINDGSNQELSWEKFEFSQSPKFDKRFTGIATDHFADHRSAMEFSGAEESPEQQLARLHQHEKEQDLQYQTQQRQEQDAWEQLDRELVQRATDLVQPLIHSQRVQRIHNVLRQRTVNTRFLFESMCFMYL